MILESKNGWCENCNAFITAAAAAAATTTTTTSFVIQALSSSPSENIGHVGLYVRLID